MWYNGYMDMRQAEVRDEADKVNRSVRLEWNRQYIINSTLDGEHRLSEHNPLKLEWAFNVSKAYNETPDRVKMEFMGGRIMTSDCAERRWEHNDDRDLSALLHLSYLLHTDKGNVNLKIEGSIVTNNATAFQIITPLIRQPEQNGIILMILNLYHAAPTELSEVH